LLKGFSISAKNGAVLIPHRF